MSVFMNVFKCVPTTVSMHISNFYQISSICASSKIIQTYHTINLNIIVSFTNGIESNKSNHFTIIVFTHNTQRGNFGQLTQNRFLIKSLVPVFFCLLYKTFFGEQVLVWMCMELCAHGRLIYLVIRFRVSEP